MLYTGGGHGVTGATGKYWIMEMHSPDLTSNSSWQTAKGFSVRIVEAMSVGNDMLAQLIVKVWDNDQSRYRSFYHAYPPEKLDFYAGGALFNATWNHLTFADWTSIQNFPTNYTVKEISVYIYGELNALFQGVVCLDEVVGIQGGGPGPTSEFTFSGNVYRGTKPDKSKPVNGVTVKLYGDVNEWPEDGAKTLLATATTNSSGAFTVKSGAGGVSHNYYHVIETDPAGSVSTGAVAVSPGYVKNYNVVSFKGSNLLPGNTYGGSDFWDYTGGGGNTQTGTNVNVPLGSDVEITFSQVSSSGNTTVSKSSTGPVAPGGFCVHPTSSPVYYDITTTATYTGPVVICIKYDDTGMTTAQETGLLLFTYEQPAGQWKNITISIDVNNNIICGEVNHLSDFAVMSSSGGGTTAALSLASGWSWISFNVLPSDLAVETVMGGLSQLAILVNNSGQFYIPGVVNGVGQLDILQGYKVYMNAAGQLSVQGQAVSRTTPINLGQGWNFISYLPQTSLPAETALASVVSQLAIAKNDAGGFYIPNVVNSLGSMGPGKGYKLYMNSGATMTYPGEEALLKPARVQNTPALRARHFQYHRRTGDYAAVVIQSLTGLEAGSGTVEVGVFTSTGRCVGAGVWTGDRALALSAWADDERTAEVEGYRPDERMRFRLWHESAEREVDLLAHYRSGSDVFSDAPYSLVDLELAALPARFNLEQNYPNPFNAGTEIAFELSQAGPVRLEIYSLLGEKIRTLVNETRDAGVFRSYWDGCNEAGISVPSGIYIYSLITPSRTASRKAVLIK